MALKLPSFSFLFFKRNYLIICRTTIIRDKERSSLDEESDEESIESYKPIYSPTGLPGNSTKPSLKNIGFSYLLLSVSD